MRSSRAADDWHHAARVLDDPDQDYSTSINATIARRASMKARLKQVTMNTATPSPILVAKFNPLIRAYLVAIIGIPIACTCIGLPLALIWFCGVGQWWARHYYRLLECQITDKTLRFRKGILFQVEKTIPLENIQDVTFVEGPILRYFQLSTLKFETAGHSAGQAHDMQLTGIIDAHAFRNHIIDAREALRQQHRIGAGSNHAATSTAADEARVAHEAAQLAVMQSMSTRLDEIAALLRERR